MSRILLVNPWIHDFSAYDLWLKPLGLLYLGSFLKAHGYEVQLIDCLRGHIKDDPFGCGELPRQVIPKPNIFNHIPRKYKCYGITPEEFSAQLASISTPSLIAVTSVMTYWYPGVFETIKYLRPVFPGVPIVLGGIYATLCYEHAVKYAGADYVIRGPGEIELLKLADKLSGVKRNYRQLNTNPDDLSYPAYELYLSRSDSLINQSPPNPECLRGQAKTNSLSYITMLTSRGCPFHCSYCASSVLSPSFLQRQPEKVVAEIEYYVREFGVKDIAFYDDALLVNPERHIDRILGIIIERGINRLVRFHTPNGLHIRYLTRERAEKLYRASFKTLRLGFESAAPLRQADSSYKTTNIQLAEALTNLYAAGFSPPDIRVYILAGVPDEALAEVNQTIDLVHRSGALISLSQYSPIPGTAYFETASKQSGLDLSEPLYHNKSVYPLHQDNFSAYEHLKDKVKILNTKIVASRSAR